MVRIAPIRMMFNPKTLWFDSAGFDLKAGDAVVVTTARGSEFGHVSDALFDMSAEDARKLKTPLKSVKRIATDEDVARADELAAQSRAALPVFKQLAGESIPDMNPIAVEYLFEGDKAVFYFDAEERVDFRDLVRKLAAELHVRVDMKQIGVRDGARMVGGLGHCGQELCCRRLGGEFNPVSIRMAKEQDLSLNPQKISGVCGRLMCCLRYEYEAYKDFHTRAPKKNARITTPDGEGKVVDLDVPREIVSIKIGDDKPVKVPLANMEPAEEGARPNAVGAEAWEEATAPPSIALDSAFSLFATELTGEDKLAEPGKVRHVHEEKPSSKSGRSRSRRRGSGGGSANAESKASTAAQGDQPTQRKSRRRRSTTVKSDGSTKVEKREQQLKQGEAKQAEKPSSSRRRRNRSSAGRQQAQGNAPVEKQQKQSQVGRNSSSLRANRPNHASGADEASGKQQAAPRRRRRSHRANSGSEGTAE